jgi:hypothetical protein
MRINIDLKEWYLEKEWWEYFDVSQKKEEESWEN